MPDHRPADQLRNRVKVQNPPFGGRVQRIPVGNPGRSLAHDVLRRWDGSLAGSGGAEEPADLLGLGVRHGRRPEPRTACPIFPDGETFILNRPNIAQHISFGRGTHSCPGAPLARMMMRITLEEALAGSASFQLAGEPEMAIWAEWGTRSVPLDFVRA